LFTTLHSQIRMSKQQSHREFAQSLSRALASLGAHNFHLESARLRQTELAENRQHTENLKTIKLLRMSSAARAIRQQQASRRTTSSTLRNTTGLLLERQQIERIRDIVKSCGARRTGACGAAQDLLTPIRM
jgi:hypothetical protein